MTAARKWPRVVTGVLSAAVLCATAGFGVVGHYALDIADNITVGNDGNFPTPISTPGPEAGAPINILVMGSDTREGKNAKGHGSAKDIVGARSDTTLLLHISGDRTRAMAVSIPRDSLVDIASCKDKDGKLVGGAPDRFNAAFMYGGPGCAVKTVQEQTGVQIDHYVVVDFTGFKGVVDALGGVEICLSKEVADPDSKLYLPSGKSLVKGEDALAFVRARETLSDGTDIARIQRQQDFLSSAIRKATSAGVLTNPAQLYQVLSAGTKSLTTDEGLANFDALQELALNISGVKPDSIVFATVPWMANSDEETISWVPSQADQLWDAMKTDSQWPPAATPGLDGKPLYTPPSEVTVNVYNATGIEGNGLKASQILEPEGYTIPVTSSTTKLVTTSTIEYNPASSEQTEMARTLATQTGATLKEVKRDPAGTSIKLLVGPDFPTKLKPVVTVKAPDSAAAPAKPRKASDNPCSEG